MDTEVSKNQGGKEQNVNPMATLANEPSFEERREKMEQRAELGEKYYQQAEAERDRWVEMAKDQLEYAKNLEPQQLQKLVNPEIFDFRYSGDRRPQYESLNESDMPEFNDYKVNEIRKAEELLRKDENADLDELAKSFKNQELIDQIAAKLKSGEEFTAEEVNFLGDVPNSDNALFDDNKFITPDSCWEKHHGFYAIPYYQELLDPMDRWGEKKSHPQWVTVAEAQVREMTKHGRALLHNDEKIQEHLSGMAEQREANPFIGETNLDSATGKARTFTLEDNYPRLENESEEDYASRLRSIQMKTRLAEKRQ